LAADLPQLRNAAEIPAVLNVQTTRLLSNTPTKIAAWSGLSFSGGADPCIVPAHDRPLIFADEEAEVGAFTGLTATPKPRYNSVHRMKIALAQTNSTVGDLAVTLTILFVLRRAAESGAHVVAFPNWRCWISARDLLEKAKFPGWRRLSCAACVRHRHLDLTIICGTITRTGYSSGNRSTQRRVLKRDELCFVRTKCCSKATTVFDENALFEPAAKQLPLPSTDAVTAVTICEDAWNDKQFGKDAFTAATR